MKGKIVFIGKIKDVKAFLQDLETWREFNEQA